MKIAVISSRFPFPLEKGDKLRLFYQLKELARKHDVYLYSITGSHPDQHSLDAVRALGVHSRYYILPKWKRMFQLSLGVFKKTPFQVLYFFDSKIRKEISRDISDENPDVIYCQLIRAFEYCKELSVPKVIDYMDAFSHIALLEAKTQSIFFKPIFLLEFRRLKKFQRLIAEYVNGATVISERDKKLLSLPIEVDVIPNGIDIDYFKPKEIKKQFDIAFVGNMGYRPNAKAARYLVNDILPELKLKGFNFSVIISGARPGIAVKRLAGKHVVVTGWVDDIRDAYAQARIFVAPIFTGAGMQNKILEAMAMGIPCVVSKEVNDGIGAERNKEIIVANDQKEFVSGIEKLLTDTEFYIKIRKNGIQWVSTNINWVRSTEKLALIFEDIKKSKD